MRVHVIGATGRTGAVLCRALLSEGAEIIPLVRDPARWAALGLPGVPRQADLTDPPSLHRALADATHIVSVSYAAWTGNILSAAPPAARLVLTGTARRYGALDDPAARDAVSAEQALRESGRDGVMLHPTMIYGAPNDGTITRLAALIRRAPILPLPGGGSHLVQPIHVDDVAAALIAALHRPWPTPASFPIAGPTPLPYAALIRAVAKAARLRSPFILAIPAPFVRLAASKRPTLLRLLEDRSVDTTAMRAELGIIPRPLDQGLHQMFT